MKSMHVYELPIARNVCNQLLREVDRTSSSSMAHVIMNPKEDSLFHDHQMFGEIYVITRGKGHLVFGVSLLAVEPGDVILIPPRVGHKLTNTGVVSLEHLVLSTPPFNPADVHLRDSILSADVLPQRFDRPPVDDCFDGAKIVAYDFVAIDKKVVDTSVAFGWVMADPKRRKPAHYHKISSEWIYVVEGMGFIEIDGKSDAPTCSSDNDCFHVFIITDPLALSLLVPSQSR